MKMSSFAQKAGDSISTSSSSAMSVISTTAESPKIPLLASKAGINFVIPKNKLSGALVPVARGGKSENNDVKKEEDLKQPSRKTKWGIDLTLDPFVKRGRALALQTRAEQIAAQLESGNFEIENDERSPSPPPIYDSGGVRLNTREVRKREQLDTERREAIGECMRLNPSYKPPSGYKAVYKEAKLFIPVKYHPGYNFIGLILGPRGNTQKRMEAETGAKIAIRGKGAMKEGKLQAMHRDGKELDGAFEDLHVHIAADTWDKIDAAVALIQPLLTPADEETNRHKQNQLKELAEINGTLWDHTEVCSLCGESGHREWKCPKDNLTNVQTKVFCRICGDIGHPTIDCPMKLKAEGKAFDKEYLNFLEELGSVNPLGQNHSSAGANAPGVSGIGTDTNGTILSQPMLLTASGPQPMPIAWTSATTATEPVTPGDMNSGTGGRNIVPTFPPCGWPGRGGLNFFFPPFYHPGLTPLGGVAFFGGRSPFLGNAFHPMMRFIPPNMMPALRQMHPFPVALNECDLRPHESLDPGIKHQRMPSLEAALHELSGKEQGLNITTSMPAEKSTHLRISQPSIYLPESSLLGHSPELQSSFSLQPTFQSCTITSVATVSPPTMINSIPDSEHGHLHVSASAPDVFLQAGLSPGASIASPVNLKSGCSIFQNTIPVNPLAPPLSSSYMIPPTVFVASSLHPHSTLLQPSLPTSTHSLLSPRNLSSAPLPVPCVPPPVSILSPPLPVAAPSSTISTSSALPAPVHPVYAPTTLPPPSIPSALPPFHGPALSGLPPPQGLVPSSAPYQPLGPPPPSPSLLASGQDPSLHNFHASSHPIGQGNLVGTSVTGKNDANLSTNNILCPTYSRDPPIADTHPKWMNPNELHFSCKDTFTPQPSTIWQHQLNRENSILPSGKPLAPGSAPPLPPPRPSHASSFIPYSTSSFQTIHLVPAVCAPQAPLSSPFPASIHPPQAAGPPHSPALPYSSRLLSSPSSSPFLRPSTSSISPAILTRPTEDTQRPLAGQHTNLSPSFSFLRHPTQISEWRPAYTQMAAQSETQINAVRRISSILPQQGPSTTNLPALSFVQSAPPEALQRLNRPFLSTVSAGDKGSAENYDPLLPTVCAASIGSFQNEPVSRNSRTVVTVASIGLSGAIDVPASRVAPSWVQAAAVTFQVNPELTINSINTQNLGAVQNDVHPPMKIEEVDAEYEKLMASVGVA